MKRVCVLNAHIIDPSQALDGPGGLIVEEGRVSAIGPGVRAGDAEIVDAKGMVLAPGLVDLRVFTGEPGSEHRETIASAGRAAAAGGVTTMLLMPDTNPPIDDVALVDFVRRTASARTGVRVLPAAAASKGLAGAAMAELRLMHDAGAVAFTDGRHGLGDIVLARRLMTYLRDFDGLLMSVAREAALAGGAMNDGALATRMGLPGQSRDAEIVPLERDLRMVASVGCRYHAATISCAESVELVRRAKAAGAPVTASAAIMHATLNENDVEGYRTFFKVYPPLRHEDDRLAIVAGLVDGTIDALVSAHDPQDVDTKRLPFADAADGAVGLETLLAAALRLHHDGSLSLSEVVERLSTAPARILGIDAGSLRTGSPADFVLFDPFEPWVVDADELLSLSKNTPYENARFSGRVAQTWVGGARVHGGTA